MDATLIPEPDRRLAVRIVPDGASGLVAGRIRPGHQLELLDWSDHGCLVATGVRLLPGIAVEMVLDTPDGRHTTRALVVRCFVRRVHQAGIIYEAGLRFERPLDMASGNALP